MPIIFEEVTGEIVPDQAAATSDAGATRSHAQEESSVETLRRDLQLLREREQRLRAD